MGALLYFPSCLDLVSHNVSDVELIALVQKNPKNS